jgi:hypothetical protein
VALLAIESYLEHGDPLPLKIAQMLGRPQKRTRTKIPIGLSHIPVSA